MSAYGPTYELFKSGIDEDDGVELDETIPFQTPIAAAARMAAIVPPIIATIHGLPQKGRRDSFTSLLVPNRFSLGDLDVLQLRVSLPLTVRPGRLR